MRSGLDRIPSWDWQEQLLQQFSNTERYYTMSIRMTFIYDSCLTSREKDMWQAMRCWVQMRSRAKMSFLHFCEGYISKSSHVKFYRYIPSSFRYIKELNFNGSPDIWKKSFFFHNTACISFSLGGIMDPLKQLIWTLYSNDDMLAI
jgi:hypothetical protein